MKSKNIIILIFIIIFILIVIRVVIGLAVYYRNDIYAIINTNANTFQPLLEVLNPIITLKNLKIHISN